MESLTLFSWTKLHGQKTLALLIDESPAFVNEMVHGKRPVPPRIAVKIEQATGNAVTRQVMRPLDWHEYWPELVQARITAPGGSDA